MDTEDQTSIQEVLSGQPAAFAVLVDRYQNRLFGLLLHMVGRREEAEDLMQETLAQAFLKLSQFQGKSSFYTWLCRIAVNLTISRRRKRSLEKVMTQASFEDTDPAEEMASVETDLLENERAERVREAVARLEEDRRTVILLRDFEGLDYDAIAEVLGIPVGTVRSRLHRARLDLREMLSDLELI